ncbi:MAG: class I fructose-bisphosphate aldolase [Carbonactinosporaceae bacterium]
MRSEELGVTARALVAEGKGILAADESIATMNKRLWAVGIAPSPEARRQFRELAIAAPGLARWISGVILSDETFRQPASDGSPLPRAAEAAGLLPGVKVDAGTQPLAGSPAETVTEGLDGLRGRLAEYVELGARFAKWRAVLRIGPGLPTAACLHANAHALARFAAACQEVGVVPVVEPEVLMDGDHGIARCEEATTETLRRVFAELVAQGVLLEGVVLKPNMVLPGVDGGDRTGEGDAAEATLRCLRRAVPAAVPGIAFLSGGQSDETATRHLDAMNRRGPQAWALTFSFGRALLEGALATWAPDRSDADGAQRVLAHRAHCNAAAAQGRYGHEMERARQLVSA